MPDTTPATGLERDDGALPNEVDLRSSARYVIDDALEAWRDQSDEDMPAWMYNPDTVKTLARFIRDRLEAAGMLAPRP